MNIVVCEDDKDLLNLIEMIVEDLDINLIKCADDAALREIMVGTQVDLLIIDYWLKKTKADVVIREIQQTNPNLPIILMSAINNLTEIKKQLKVDDYLSKPFDIDLFKSKIINYSKSSQL